jgi:hypothetical protein
MSNMPDNDVNVEIDKKGQFIYLNSLDVTCICMLLWFVTTHSENMFITSLALTGIALRIMRSV